MPKMIRELVAELEKAGFTLASGGKGSHRKFRHLKVKGFTLVSGKSADDARSYQEKHVSAKIEKFQS